MMVGSTSSIGTMYTKRPMQNKQMQRKEGMLEQKADLLNKKEELHQRRTSVSEVDRPTRKMKPFKVVQGLVDTNGDASWSLDELSEFARSAEAYGVTIDAEELMNTYDLDGDQQLGKDELKTVREDKALGFSSIEQFKTTMWQMQLGVIPDTTQDVGEVADIVEDVTDVSEEAEAITE